MIDFVTLSSDADETTSRSGVSIESRSPSFSNRASRVVVRDAMKLPVRSLLVVGANVWCGCDDGLVYVWSVEVRVSAVCVFVRARCLNCCSFFYFCLCVRLFDCSSSVGIA